MMTRLRFNILPFTMALALTGCATSQAGKIRQSKPVTVGANFRSNVIAEYRPSKNLGIDAVYMPGTLGIESDISVRSVIEGAVRDLKEEKPVSIYAGLSYYPWDSSAFRLGLGGSQQQSNVKFFTLNKTVDGPLIPVEYKVNYTYGSVSAGWNLVFESLWGFTFGFDLAVHNRIAANSTMVINGGDSVDVTDRDDYFKAYEKSRRTMYGSLLSHYGWSF